MTVFLKILKWITRALMYVCYAAILVLLVLTVSDVIMRYGFGKPSTGVTEYSQMLLIICMTCLAHAIAEGRYISVGVIVDRFPKKLNFAFEIIMGAAACVFFYIVGSQMILAISQSIQYNERYFVLGTPRWPMYMILGIAFLACVLATVVYVIERIRNYTPPKEKDFFDDNPDLAILAHMDEYKVEKEAKQ